MTGHHGVFPCDPAPFLLVGPAGGLEVMTTCPPENSTVTATAVVCHPHPQYGGTMHNKAVHTLARAFTDMGLRTVRFNFRGVGASEGRFAAGAGESEDLVAVLNWLRFRRRDDEVWLAGFSFGAYVAVRTAARWPVTRLIAVAPPVHLYGFTELPIPRVPLLVVQGDRDKVVPATSVMRWVESSNPRPDLAILRGVGHFFHHRLNDLRAEICNRLAPYLPGTHRSS